MHAYKPFKSDDIKYSERIVYSDITVSGSIVSQSSGPYESALFNYKNYNDGIFAAAVTSSDTNQLSQSILDSIGHCYYNQLIKYNADFDFYDHRTPQYVFKEHSRDDHGMGVLFPFTDASVIHNNPQHKTNFTSSAVIYAISSSLIGEGIKPGSLVLEENSAARQITIKDDGFGNLYASGDYYNISQSNESVSSSDNYIGNIFYENGNIIVTKNEYYTGTYNLPSITLEAEGPNMNAQNNLVEGLFFKPDGTKYWMVGSAGDDKVFEYDMSTAWDVSTATYNGKSYYPLVSGVRDINFKPDGTKMYLLNGGAANQIYEYDMSTAWDIHTAGVVQSRNISEHDGSAEGFYFRNDGLKIYMTGLDNDKVHEFNLSTAWDVKTFTDVSQSYAWSASLAAVEDGIGGVTFHPDGSRMYTSGYTQDAIYEHRLSTAWDISTATFYTSKSIQSDESNIHAVQWKQDGSKMYILGHGNDTVHQYNMPSASRYSDLGTDYTASFQSSNIIRTLEWRCVIEPEEFNISQNPTILPSGSYTSSITDDSRKYDYWTGDVILPYGDIHSANVIPEKNIVPSKFRSKNFSPYISKIGLYNKENELIIAATLPTPLQKPKKQRIILNIQMDF